MMRLSLSSCDPPSLTRAFLSRGRFSNDRRWSDVEAQDLLIQTVGAPRSLPIARHSPCLTGFAWIRAHAGFFLDRTVDVLAPVFVFRRRDISRRCRGVVSYPGTVGFRRPGVVMAALVRGEGISRWLKYGRRAWRGRDRPGWWPEPVGEAPKDARLTHGFGVEGGAGGGSGRVYRVAEHVGLSLECTVLVVLVGSREDREGYIEQDDGGSGEELGLRVIRECDHDSWSASWLTGQGHESRDYDRRMTVARASRRNK